MIGDSVGGTIRWRLHLAASPRIVFDTIATDEGRSRFWAEQTTSDGNTVTFRFANGLVHTGRILRFDPERVFSVEYLEGPATIELVPDGHGGTDLLLDHAVTTAEGWHETYAGWLNVLLPLKCWLVAGVDIRNRDPQRTWDTGYVDQ